LRAAVSRAIGSFVDPLEPRSLFSASLPTVGTLPAEQPSIPTIEMSWNGQTGLARDGQWTVGLSKEFRNANKGKALADTPLGASLAEFGIGRDALAWADGPGGAWLGTLHASPDEAENLAKWAARAKSAGVSYVEPDWVFTAATLPSDTYFSDQWGLNDANDRDVDAPEAWLNSEGSGVIVAVVDSGVDWDHTDLDGSIWANPNDPLDGIDNDGNGGEDYHGWDFYDGDNNPDHGAGDTLGHGTAVAGVIGAERNGSGVVGVSYGATVMPLRAGIDDSIDGQAAAYAIHYAAEQKIYGGQNVRVINLSFASTTFYTPLYDAIEYARDAGILVVCSAGNDGVDNDNAPYYPASFSLDNIVSVAATDDLDNLASFSNFGATSVDLGAPGVDIRTTDAGGGWGWWDGTSFAAPYVAGVAALVSADVPDLSVQELREALLRNVVKINSLNTTTATHGRLNAYNALRNTRQMDFGTENSVATDSAGRMYVAYYDSASKSLKFVSRGTDGLWSSPQTIEAPQNPGNPLAEMGHYPSLALTSAGAPRVAYYDAESGDMKYAELVSGSWTKTIVQSVNTVGLYPSLKFDTSDNPAIAYYAATAGSLRFAERISGAWTPVDVQTSGVTDVGRYPSLAKNPNTGMKWAISYHDTANGDLRYAERTSASTTWDPTVRIDNGLGDRGWYSSLFFDGNDPYVSYYDGVNGDLYLTKRPSGAWAGVPERVTGATTNSGLYSTIWKDGSTWNIVYMKKGATAADNQLLRAYGGPGAWSFQTLESGGGNEARAVRTTSGQFAYTWSDASSGDLLFSELINN
jgi:subtilisin family serine protease